MSTTVFMLGVAALAAVLQWTTRRLSISILLPPALLAIISMTNYQGADNGRPWWFDLVSLLPVVITLCASAALVTRAFKNRGQKKPALDTGLIKWVAGIFAAYAVYSIYMAIGYKSYEMYLLAAVSLAAAIGLWTRQSWSQYLVYSICAVFNGWWAWAAWQSIRIGSWDPVSVDQYFLGLLPGFMFLAVAIGCCLVAYRSFRIK